MDSDEQVGRRRGPSLTTLLAFAATVFLMFRQASSGFDSGWFTIAVIIAFVVASVLLVRELTSARRP